MAELHGLTCATNFTDFVLCEGKLVSGSNYFTSFSMISSSFDVIVVAVCHANLL